MKLWAALGVALAAVAFPAGAGQIVGISAPAAGGAPIFVAEQEGFYAKHGLDVRLELVALMPNMPAILASGAAQFGVLTPTTVIQAVEGGLDMVAFSGGSVITHDHSNQMLVVRAGLDLKSPKDFIGKRIGVPGFGANLHVTLLYWFEKKGVDPKSLTFVEVTFPTMRDLLAAKQVDAVIAIDPILGQIVASHTGTVFAEIAPDLPEGMPDTIYVAMRDWASAHPGDIKSLQGALADAEDFTNREPDKTKADVAAHLKMPPELVKRLKLSHQDPTLTPQQLGWWVEVMKRNKLIAGTVDPAKMILAR